MFKNSPLVTGKTRSQDQKIFYKPNPVGNTLWLKNKNLSGKTIYDKAIPFITNPVESLDLDTEEDLILIKCLLN